MNQRGQKKYVFQTAWKRLSAHIFDSAGYLLLYFLTWGRGWAQASNLREQPRSIVCWRPDHLGDLLFARPALLALRWKFPQTRIVLICSQAGAALTGRDDFIDERLIWDAPWFARGSAGDPPAGLLARLRQERFDISIDWRGDLRHHWLAYRSGIPLRLGYGITGGGFLLQHAPRLPKAQHEVERNFALLRHLGVEAFPPVCPPLPVSPEAQAWAQAQWRPGPGLRLVIHPGAGDPDKCWPTAEWKSLLAVMPLAGAQILAIGTRAERERSEGLASAFPGLRLLQGQTSLEQTIALISSAQLLVGHDSGPAHLAMTQGIPVVYLWGDKNDPQEWGPWGAQARAWVIPRKQMATAAKTLSSILQAMPEDGGKRAK
jgi:ADP-heptose:LPS heptosyltransferase